METPAFVTKVNENRRFSAGKLVESRALLDWVFSFKHPDIPCF